MPAHCGGKCNVQDVNSDPNGLDLLASPTGRSRCDADTGGSDKRGNESGEKEAVVYSDGNLCIKERNEPGLKSITISIGGPPGQCEQAQQKNTGGQSYGQGSAQLRSSQPPRRSPGVVIPADKALPIGNIPQPKGPPLEQMEWPKNSQTNDTCEIQDIDAAANLKTKYGENPCKPPPAKKRAATALENSSGSNEAQSSRPLVNDDVSQRSTQPMGRTSDGDISNYGSSGYTGNYTPRQPACSGAQHDMGGRYQAPTPYEPRPPPQHPWPEDNRRIESSGQYTYPPAPPSTPRGQHQFPPTPPPTPMPPRAYGPSSGPPQSQECPPEERWYDAQEDFYYDASSEADWCPPGYVPSSRPCNYCHAHVARWVPIGELEKDTDHNDGQLTQIQNTEFQQDNHDLGDPITSNENASCNPLLIPEHNGDHTVIIRQRKGHHKEGCPWQRMNNHRIQPGDVRNTCFARAEHGVLNADNMKEVGERCKSVLRKGENGQVSPNAYWQHYEPFVDLRDVGNREERPEHLYTGDLVPISDVTAGEGIDFFQLPHNSFGSNVFLEEDLEYIRDHNDGGVIKEVNEDNPDGLQLIMGDLNSSGDQGPELMSAMTDRLDAHNLEPCIEQETEHVDTDGIVQDSNQVNCTSPKSGPIHTLNLIGQRPNPALPLVLRLGSWVKDVLLPDYSK